MNRYLLHISYIGTHFRGLQKHLNTQKDQKSSVQGAIELGIKLVHPVNEPKLILSSRTDTGVHALHSCVHVDLLRKNGKPYPASGLTVLLNKFFENENVQIRVHKTEIVPDTFHCRYSAIRRTYLYRLAVSKGEHVENRTSLTKYIPIEEIDRCYFLRNSNFDIDSARRAADLIKGKHDFRTFMGASQQNSEHDHPFFALRRIDSIKIEPGQSTCNTYSIQKAHNNFDYWNILITGRSFLNRQVRRMVGVILGVAQNRITHRDVYEMLTIPSSNSWCTRAAVVPPHGLYLCQIDYNEEDKEFPLASEANYQSNQATMSFLNELKRKKKELKKTVTIVTRPDGTKIRDDGVEQTLVNYEGPGFVVDTSPDKIPACVLENFLYLGSQDCADIAILENFGISHVLSIGIPMPDGCWDNIVSTFITCLDLPETPLNDILTMSNKFIEAAKASGGKVLVHCNAGVSRSASVVLGYLIMIGGYSFEDAYDLVKSKRSCIRPNDGFLKQLKKL